MGEKANFEIRECNPGAAMSADGKKYLGTERRRDTRRSGMDRRTEVRFEPGKDDRRQSYGRRHDDTRPQFW